MNASERDKLWKLYSITNKMGGVADCTAISTVALAKYKQAHSKVSKVISLIITGEDDELCQKYINELDALSRWNFADRNGRITEEEKRVNEHIKTCMNGWTPMSDF